MNFFFYTYRDSKNVFEQEFYQSHRHWAAFIRGGLVVLCCLCSLGVIVGQYGFRNDGALQYRLLLLSGAVIPIGASFFLYMLVAMNCKRLRRRKNKKSYRASASTALMKLLAAQETFFPRRFMLLMFVPMLLLVGEYDCVSFLIAIGIVFWVLSPRPNRQVYIPAIDVWAILRFGPMGSLAYAGFLAITYALSLHFLITEQLGLALLPAMAICAATIILYSSARAWTDETFLAD